MSVTLALLVSVTGYVKSKICSSSTSIVIRSLYGIVLVTPNEGHMTAPLLLLDLEKLRVQWRVFHAILNDSCLIFSASSCQKPAYLFQTLPRFQSYLRQPAFTPSPSVRVQASVGFWDNTAISTLLSHFLKQVTLHR